VNSSRSGTSLAEEFYLTTTLANGKREGKSGAQKTGKIGKETSQRRKRRRRKKKRRSERSSQEKER